VKIVRKVVSGEVESWREGEVPGEVEVKRKKRFRVKFHLML